MLREEAKKEQIRLEEVSKEIQKKQDFFTALEKSGDLNLELQSLCNFVAKTTDATGVYIGKQVYMKKPIDEDAGENDAFDENTPKVIQFTHANASHQAMVNTVLSAEDAPMSHSVFTFSEVPTQQTNADET